MIDFYKVLRCTPETVTDDDIETLKMYEEQKLYPPRFKLEFSPTGSSRNTKVELTLCELHALCLNGPPVHYNVTLGE